MTCGDVVQQTYTSGGVIRESLEVQLKSRFASMNNSYKDISEDRIAAHAEYYKNQNSSDVMIPDGEGEYEEWGDCSGDMGVVQSKWSDERRGWQGEGEGWRGEGGDGGC